MLGDNVYGYNNKKGKKKHAIKYDSLSFGL